MTSVRIQTNAIERIQVTALNGSLVPLTGLTDLKLAIVRVSDGMSYDFSDNTFKAAAWVTRQLAMTELSAASYPGEYYYDFNTSAITNKTANDTYMIDVRQTPGTSVKNVPQAGEIKEGQFVDKLDAAVSSRATQAQILSDATPFAGASIAAILADTAAMEPIVSLNLDAKISSVMSAIAALNNLSIADVQTAMTNQGYTAARAVLLSSLTNLDAAISSVLTAIAGLNNLSSAQAQAAASAALVAYDAATGADVTSATAPLATTADLAIVDGNVDAILLDTAAIDARLPADPADQSAVEAAISASETAIRGIDSDTLKTLSDQIDDVPTVAELAAAVAPLATSAGLSTVDGKVDAIKSQTDLLRFTGNDVKATLDGEHVAVASVDTDAIDADALKTDAIAEIAAGTDFVLSGTHGPGPWGGGGGGLTAQQTCDAVMKLAPTAGVPAVGSLKETVTDINAKTTNLPTDPADESLLEAAITAATSPLATGAALATVDSNVDAILLDTAAIDARLPSDPADESLLEAAIVAATSPLATGAALAIVDGIVDSILADTAAIDGRLPADPADQSAVESAITAATSPLATGAALAIVDGNVDSILVDTSAMDARLPADPADQSAVEAAISASEAAIRGTDGDDLKDISDQIDAISVDIDARLVLIAADIARALGLSHENIFIDNTVYDADGQLVEARTRIFDTKAHCDLATDGGTETAGLIGSYTLESAWEFVNQFKTFKQVRDS